ncbi:MAG: hypothetical protein CMP23_05220 [Rickettsiales bacterium]|nr:hypothetical protein [Rickettsiales bacterium]
MEANMTTESETPGATEPGAEPRETTGDTPDLQAEMDAFIEGAAGLFGNLKEIFLKSKDEVARGAQLGKVRIDVFQLRKDREHFLQRLGEEAYELLRAGQLSHPDLEKPFAKVIDLDERIVAVEAEVERLAAEQLEAREAVKAAANDAEDADGAAADPS